MIFLFPYFITKAIFDYKILSEVSNILMSRKETLALAESVTGGFLQAAFSTVQDGSKFLQGGITAYNLGQKYRHLLIEPIHAQESNCVSEEIAAQMAAHVCDMFSSHWGLSITGYAVPVPESGNKLFAYYSIAYKGEMIAKGKIEPQRDDAVTIQLLYVQVIIKAFRGKL